MKSLRNFACASLLTLAALNFAPHSAAAQDATGKFTLTHAVRWQSATIPAGEYKFKAETRGASALLTLSKVDAPNAGYMLLVNDTESATTLAGSRLLLVAREGKSFVREMELPELVMKLHFAVPSESTEVAKTEMAAASAGSR